MKKEELVEHLRVSLNLPLQEIQPRPSVELTPEEIQQRKGTLPNYTEENIRKMTNTELRLLGKTHKDILKGYARFGRKSELSAFIIAHL